jgi:hypothetical protein
MVHVHDSLGECPGGFLWHVVTDVENPVVVFRRELVPVRLPARAARPRASSHAPQQGRWLVVGPSCGCSADSCNGYATGVVRSSCGGRRGSASRRCCRRRPGWPRLRSCGYSRRPPCRVRHRSPSPACTSCCGRSSTRSIGCRGRSAVPYWRRSAGPTRLSRIPVNSAYASPPASHVCLSMG